MRAFRAAGWRAVGVARRRERLDRLAASTGAEVFVGDVTKQSDVDALRDQLARTGPVHALVNNAGGARGLDSVETSDVADWQWMFDVNVLGTKRMVQALLPLLREAADEPDGHADIVNLTSTASLQAYAGGGAYNAAKAAQHMLTDALRLELLGEPIRVTEVAPGLVKTEEFALNRFHGDESRAEATYEGVEKPLSAEDVASVIVDAVDRPGHVDLGLIVVRPVAQATNFHLHRGPLRPRR